MPQKFQALRQFGYGGKLRLPGEVFDRQYLRNDAKLMRDDAPVRFLQVLSAEELSDHDLAHCDQCGRDFVAEHYYHAHLPVVHDPSLAPREAPRPTRLEDEYPGGAVIGATGQVTAKRR